MVLSEENDTARIPIQTRGDMHNLIIIMGRLIITFYPIR